ncbi:adenine deaminase [Saccharicrinis fermentans]|uniref:Adenine deaminase n=1 Tax=Saccharicrinis fermentans DSM 9555 = JCM 21142 TaxID=869213 RepID=W7XUT6_9BACT|nr:adenine deaminase [Saccharicrinis fermentans]GAF01790.1 adenine deaminase [Saccharicrinis fermentans DSM 9555 = JCM 21142]
MDIKGKVVDITNRNIFNGIVSICNGMITNIEEIQEECTHYILPGLIDGHVHIESSMLTPTQFSKIVVPRGTVAVVTDPHEIANVMGVEGVNYMIEDAKKTPLKCFFGAPSCVPATSFETSGAIINATTINELLQRDDIWFLSEMMNFPGVIFDDKEVWDKVKAAHSNGKRIDGHAPGLMGNDLKKYTRAGISSDHECVSVKEAIQKIEQGVCIQIREGSAAKNFKVLAPLFHTHPDDIMLCTDDSHPDEIIQKGHIDKIIRLGLSLGLDIFDLLKAAILKPIEHYQLPVGRLRVGDAADLIVVDTLTDFNILETFIDGQPVYGQGKVLFEVPTSKVINNFNISSISEEDICVAYKKDCNIRVIEAKDGDLLTDEFIWTPSNSSGFIKSSVNDDILKIVVLNRYKTAPPVVGFIKNIGLKQGAIACSVAHDSHNLIAVGVSDKDIVSALNEIIAHKGGMAYAFNDDKDCLALEVGGLMTGKPGRVVAEKYQTLNIKAQELGSTLAAPFMTLSFMSLLVIPKLKIGDKGLFDVSSFSFTNLYA